MDFQERWCWWYDTVTVTVQVVNVQNSFAVWVQTCMFSEVIVVFKTQSGPAAGNRTEKVLSHCRNCQNYLSHKQCWLMVRKVIQTEASCGKVLFYWPIQPLAHLLPYVDITSSCFPTLIIITNYKGGIAYLNVNIGGFICALYVTQSGCFSWEDSLKYMPVRCNCVENASTLQLA